MSSRISIANVALTGLGAARISSLGEDSENARRLNAIFDYCLDDLLREHPWNFSIKRLKLEQLVEKPLFGYDYIFQLPTACLRVIEVNDGSYVRDDFKIEDRKLLCDLDTVYIKCILRIEDTNQYSSQFCFVLASRLAAEIAYAVTNNKATAEMAYQIYQQRLQAAKAADAQESSSVNTLDADKWTIEDRA
jgi:hypothetical protein